MLKLWWKSASFWRIAVGVVIGSMLFALPAAAVAVLGPFFGVPGIAMLGPRATSAAIAGGLFFFGLLLGRTADD